MAEHPIPRIQFTLRSLMICVAVAALLMFLERYFGDRLFFGLLPVFAALLALGLRRLKPPGHHFSPREQIQAGLICLAAITPAAALRLVWMMGPAASTFEHIQGFLILVAAGAAPLAIFLFVTTLLRSVAPDPATFEPDRSTSDPYHRPPSN